MLSLALVARDTARQHAAALGRGPTRVDAWQDDDFVVVLMRGGLTVPERTLVDSGQHEEVVRARRAMQETMRPGLVESVERHTGREVVAFMSTTHVNPDLSAEMFLLGGPA
jgi:uncharacterized protein YbcI